WNVTARFNHPFIKVFEEERELTVMLVIDVSGSRNFGTAMRTKRELITEIAAVLSFSAIQNNDKIGAILFSNKVEKFIPPKKGRSHILRIIRELLDFEPQEQTTNISEALRYLTNAIKKKSISFLISDFIAPDFEDAIRIANQKHDLIALQIYDPRETEMPPVGLMKLQDAETGSWKWVDTFDTQTRNAYRNWWITRQQKLVQLFRKSGVDNASIRTNEDYIKPLINIFKNR
ncbi:MAG: VWA domain-containing protein, partial [Bacteroidetes bacterium]|nr:VWA domain-containing protein [Bacteroidota bacterium]